MLNCFQVKIEKLKQPIRKVLTQRNDTDVGTECERSDRKAVCLFCWQADVICRDSHSLRCLLCLQAVDSGCLDAHTDTHHAHLEFGVFTCQGKNRVLAPKYGGVLGTRLLEPERFQCQLCSACMSTPKLLKEHLVKSHAVKGAESGISQIATCRHCQRFFCNAMQAEDHQYFCKGVSLQSLPECKECSVKFAFPYLYNKHMKTVHHAIKKTNLDCYAEASAIDELKVCSLTVRNLVLFSGTVHVSVPAFTQIHRCLRIDIG